MSDHEIGGDNRRIYYGVAIGILMVRTYFTRYLGDIGNAATWEFPVSYKIVEDAIPSKMTDLHNASLLEPFKVAAKELVAEGVSGITTTCGFLSIYQNELADHCGVPVASSSLLQVPFAQTIIGTKKRVGVMTYNGSVLQGPYLEAVDVPQDTPVKGMPQNSEFVRWINNGDVSISFDTLREEALVAAREFQAEYPDLGAIVLECTNLAPFSADISSELGLPVFDCVTLVNWLHAGLRPQRHEPGV